MMLEATERALALTSKSEILVVGGVAASGSLKEKLEEMTLDWGVKLSVVPQEFAGDNGAMIAYAGLLQASKGAYTELSESKVRQRWRIDEWSYCGNDLAEKGRRIRHIPRLLHGNEGGVQKEES